MHIADLKLKNFKKFRKLKLAWLKRQEKVVVPITNALSTQHNQLQLVTATLQKRPFFSWKNNDFSPLPPGSAFRFIRA